LGKLVRPWEIRSRRSIRLVPPGKRTTEELGTLECH
jgi:hypothetical protein